MLNLCSLPTFDLSWKCLATQQKVIHSSISAMGKQYSIDSEFFLLNDCGQILTFCYFHSSVIDHLRHRSHNVCLYDLSIDFVLKLWWRCVIFLVLLIWGCIYWRAIRIHYSIFVLLWQSCEQDIHVSLIK
jgi:hypothetical protein